MMGRKCGCGIIHECKGKKRLHDENNLVRMIKFVDWNLD
jgi:hypothetical protein